MKTRPALLFLSIIGLASSLSAQPAAPKAISEFVSPGVHSMPDPAFPQSLLERGVTEGNACVEIGISSTGKLSDWLIVAYSHKEFADVAVASIKQCKWEPATLHGQPISSQVRLDFTFRTSGPVIVSNSGMSIIDLFLGMHGNYSYGPCSMRDLDKIPAPIGVTEPVYPLELKQKGVEGVAVVEFYIDESGQPRMPAIVNSDFDELGSIAVNAVRGWKFEPPTRKGVPVMTCVRQRFIFGKSEK